jgi:hypothetical protein
VSHRLENQTHSSTRGQLSVMGIFILAMVSNGRVRTLYDFKRASISPGAVAGPIADLIRKDYLSKTKDSEGRQEFALTAEGSRALVSEWPSFLDLVHTDVNDILRVFWLGCLMGHEEDASTYLQRCAYFRAGMRSGGKGAQIPDLEGVDLRDPIKGYKWMRDYWNWANVRTDEGTFGAIAQLADEKPVIAGVKKRSAPLAAQKRRTKTED